MPDTLSRTLQPTRRVLGDVDPVQPLDTTSSLTDGLQGFWLPLPRLTGGSRLYDLSAQGRHGEIVGITGPWSNSQETQTPTLSFDGTVSHGIEVKNQPIVYNDSFTIHVYLSGFPIADETSPIGGENSTLDGNGDADQWWQLRANALNSILWSFDDGGNKFQLAGAKGRILEWHTRTLVVDNNEGETREYTNGDLGNTTFSTPGNFQPEQNSLYFGTNNRGKAYSGKIGFVGVWSDAKDPSKVHEQTIRGFPDLLRTRSDVGLLGGGGTTPISGTFALTDAQEQFSATGQTEVSGTLSVTDSAETLTVEGATKVSGTTSITDGVETFLASGTADVQGDVAVTDSGEIITASGSVITTGSVSITDGGEIISAVSSLQDITGTAQITDAGEEVSATGEVKIAGTATLNDGTEEVIIIGQNDVTGSLSFADLAAEIAATGSVEVQGSLALTDAGETITARERVPARLASVDVRLEDIIIVNAKLTD